MIHMVNRDRLRMVGDLLGAVQNYPKSARTRLLSHANIRNQSCLFNVLVKKGFIVAVNKNHHALSCEGYRLLLKINECYEAVK